MQKLPRDCLDNEDNNWKENQCFFRDRVLLFDLSVDPEEQEDLSALMTDVVDRMQVMTLTSYSYIHKVRHCNDIVGIEVLRLFTNLLICLCRRFYLSKYQICRQGCRSTWTGQWSRSTWPRTTLACHQTTSHQVPAHHGEMFHISHFDLFSYLPNRRVLQRLYTKYHHILVKNPYFPGQFFTGWCEAQSSPER